MKSYRIEFCFLDHSQTTARSVVQDPQEGKRYRVYNKGARNPDFYEVPWDGQADLDHLVIEVLEDGSVKAVPELQGRVSD